ncbi:MAG: hypothetical protein N4A31_01465 [Rickettsiales bacterium]|nr:hypothetical protein [Rickettsiales bacterium]
MSKSKDENNITKIYTPLMFKHVDSLAKIHNNTSEKIEDSPIAIFPHVDSRILLGSITIEGIEGPIDGDCSTLNPQQNTDSTS